jgi:transcriptional regulator with XRE-family HTH domain
MFYERLSLLCKEKGIPLTELLKILGMSSGNLSKWKAGNAPKAPTVARIAKYFKVSSDYLMGATDIRETLDEQLTGVDFALSGEIKKLSAAEKQDILDYIRFKKLNKRNDEE